MTQIYLYVADAVAVSLLTFALYFPRHRRRDLLLAYLGVNVGVLAVTVALLASDATIGLGLGLFGVLSIIRLRSNELGQHEVAYYFASLALGLLGGLGATNLVVTVTLMTAIVAVLYVGDHPRLFGRHRQQTMLLDRAHTSESELVAALERLLDARVHSIRVQKVDLVNDTTLVDVRFSTSRDVAAPRPESIHRLVGQGGGRP